MFIVLLASLKIQNIWISELISTKLFLCKFCTRNYSIKISVIDSVMKTNLGCIKLNFLTKKKIESFYEGDLLLTK